MSSINFATREISCKVVYYGPGLSGKTTNLQVIHQKMPQDKRTDMVSLATEGDRTLFFDFLPLNLGDIKGFKTRFQLYTVPGQVYYNSTRKLVLRGVDGIVFVADSQRSRQAENLESLQNLRQNLQDYGMDLDDMPFVLQYNKRDMDNVFTLDELNAELNPRNVPFFPATAHNGKGVVTTLKTIAMLVIEKFNVKQGFLRQAGERTAGREPSGAARDPQGCGEREQYRRARRLPHQGRGLGQGNPACRSGSEPSHCSPCSRLTVPHALVCGQAASAGCPWCTCPAFDCRRRSVPERSYVFALRSSPCRSDGSAYADLRSRCRQASSRCR